MLTKLGARNRAELMVRTRGLTDADGAATADP